LGYTKDLNILLYPEGEKSRDTLNLKWISEEKRKEIEALLAA
jgi:hypothetical protein